MSKIVSFGASLEKGGKRGVLSHKFLISNLLRSVSPCLTNNHAMGDSARPMKPRMLLPQPMPRRLYMGRPARGRTDPAMERMTAFAARAEAA